MISLIFFSTNKEITNYYMFRKKDPSKQTTTNLDSRKNSIKGEIWILVPHLGVWTNHLVTNGVILSQPVLDFQSKNRPQIWTCGKIQ